MKAKYLEELEKKYNIQIKNIISVEAGWINEKYILETENGKKYFLKELSLEKFPSTYYPILCKKVFIQNELYNMGVCVPKVYKNNKGELISRLSNKKNYFLQHFIESNDFKNELSEYCIYDLGVKLSYLHNCLSLLDCTELENDFFKYKNVRLLKNELNDRINQINSKSSIDYIREVSLHEKIIEDIETSKILEKQKLQLIHGDFTPDNIIFDNNGVLSILDYELMRINTRLQDIGRIILSVCFENGKVDGRKLQSFINGYNNNLKLTYDDIINSLKIVWINEVNIWIKDRYFLNYNPPKVQKFIEEMMWISKNWFNIEGIIKDVLSDEKDKNKLQYKFYYEKQK